MGFCRFDLDLEQQDIPIDFADVRAVAMQSVVDVEGAPAGLNPRRSNSDGHADLAKDRLGLPAGAQSLSQLPAQAE